MSYYFEMRFLPVSSREEAFSTSIEFANALASRNTARKYINGLLSRMEKLPFSYDERKDFVTAAFQVHCTYWPELNLLGLTTKNWPEDVFGGFSFTEPIQFQNSTDQDYPLETWDDRVPAFKEIKERVSGMSGTEILSAMGWDDGDLWGSTPKIDYALKSLVYKEIFRKLDLNNWLHGNCGQFERFAVSGVTTAEMVGYLTLLTKSMVTEMDAESLNIRPLLWESAAQLSDMQDDSLAFLISEINEARKTGKLRPESCLANMVVNYQASQQCVSTDTSLKEIEASINRELAKRYLEMVDHDEDARKNGWLYVCKDGDKTVKIVRGEPGEDAWEFAVIADWPGSPLILKTCADEGSARAYIAENSYVCTGDESQKTSMD